MGCGNSKHDKQRSRKTVFHSLVFRIPALYYNKNEKKLFAFSEKRTSIKDSDAVALVMSTGTVDTDDTTKKKTAKWSKPEEVVGVIEMEGSKYRPMNPCLVYEKNTQILFLFFNRITGEENAKNNKVRLCYMTKKKNDDKWSEVTDVTDVLPTDSWSTFSVGPGHGIQTESDRIIVPAYAYMKKDKIPHSFYIYSDDNGSTWQYGMMLGEQSGECQVAEVSDGLIYCNARNQGGYRVQAQIDKSGFHSFKHTTPLVETGTGCHGSVISFPAQSGDANTKWLLYSHPTNKSKRRDLGIYLNKSPMKSLGKCKRVWSKPWVINKGPSGYSDLTYIEDGWFACLMERGKKTYTEKIACLLFHYDEIKR
ncbi:sialidase-3-like [Gambusia affinis]|uniref:sialidase-3-like n=1 Tax=Gambusia affinis TaxID=33528 RepID=UPI001CDB5842|nr:sialidase-3-like [Gambusia affinis]